MAIEVQTILDGFYEEIMARLQAKVPALKHFDVYYGQYNNPEVDKDGNVIGPSFNRPAGFLEWPADLQFQPLGLKRKASTMTFGLHLVQDVPQDIDRRTPEAVRAKGHLHTTMISDAQNALEGFSGDQAINFKHFGTISMAGLAPYLFMGPQIVHIPRFRVRIVVDAAKKFYVKLADLTPPVEATDETTNQIVTIEQL